MKNIGTGNSGGKSLYYSYKQYFSDYLPALTKLGLKVVMALLVFVGGRKVIQWFVSFIKKSMERASVDKGVIQFTGSLLRIVLYILLVFSIATHFGVRNPLLQHCLVLLV